MTSGAVDWLRTHGTAGPFCLFVHYDGPHMSYRLPDAFALVNPRLKEARDRFGHLAAVGVAAKFVHAMAAARSEA